MGKYVAAVVLLASYAAVAVWVVREEWTRYRADLHRAKGEPTAATADDAATAPEPAAPVAESAPAPVEASSVEPAAVALAKAEPHKSALRKAEVRRPKAAPGKKAAAPAAHSPRTAPTPPEAGTKPDELWQTPRMKEVWDVAHLRPADEQRLGAALNGLVLELERPRGEGPYLRRAEHAARPLFDAFPRKDIPYTITILDSEYPNAFSHPGGYIYLTKGLFDLIGEDEGEDFVLQFVIAHEMAHVELQHAIKCLNDPDLAKSKLGTLPQFFVFLFPLGYPDAMDFEADRLAYDRMTHQLQRTPHAALAFLRRLEGYARRNGFENGRSQLRPLPDASPLDNHLRAHPPVFRRIDRLTAPAAKPGP
ncbi:MAG TPA: M48 family metallopeptidase [Isosphaeraceae bacterium]